MSDQRRTTRVPLEEGHVRLGAELRKVRRQAGRKAVKSAPSPSTPNVGPLIVKGCELFATAPVHRPSSPRPNHGRRPAYPVSQAAQPVLQTF